MKGTFVIAVALLVLVGVTSGKDFKLKVKNGILDKEENDDIHVDENKGTETITSEGHTSMKDFNTGYTAIKNDDKKECLIVKNENPDEQSNVADLEKDLEAIETSDKEPEVIQEAVEDISNSTELTDEQRAAIGQNLVDFCGEYEIVLGTTELESQRTGVQEGQAEEVEEDHSVVSSKDNTPVKSRKKRGLCVWRQVYVQRVCLRRYYRALYSYCCNSGWMGCYNHCYGYRYYCTYTCYYRYFYRYYYYNCW